MEFILKTEEGTQTFADRKEFNKAVRKEKKRREELEQLRYENMEEAKREAALLTVDLVHRCESDDNEKLRNFTIVTRDDGSELSKSIWKDPSYMTFQASRGYAAPDKDYAQVPERYFDAVLVDISDRVVAIHHKEPKAGWYCMAIKGSQWFCERMPKTITLRLNSLWDAKKKMQNPD